MNMSVSGETSSSDGRNRIWSAGCPSGPVQLGCSLYTGYRQTTEAGTVWKEFGDGGCYRPNGYIDAITGTFDVNDAFGVDDWSLREGGTADCPVDQNPSNAKSFSGERTQLSGVCLTKCYGGSSP